MFKHRILNIITIISVLIVLALPIYSKYILFPSYNAFLIDQAESVLKGIARNMVEHNNLKQPISNHSPLPTDFINDVEHIRKTTGLWKVKIFTPAGQIVYSTHPADVGNQTTKNFFPEMFRDNALKSHIAVKELTDAGTATASRHYFIETYVPILQNNIPLGAFEIYYDITEIKQSLEALKYKEQKILIPIIFLLLAGGLISSYVAHKTMSELKKSKERFKELSMVDELTGLLNRRGFVRELEKQLQTSTRNRSTSFLLFLDLNDFKKINDRFGHEIGDEALMETAKILQATFRGSDTIGRFGGDEFAVLAPQVTDTDDSRAIHERIEENVRQWNREAKAEYELSLSFGIARFSPTTPCSVDELLKKADALMYKQKYKRKKQQQV